MYHLAVPLLFVAVLFTYTTSAKYTEAVVLKPIANIAIRNAELVELPSGETKVYFKVKNMQPTHNLEGLKYGIRLQDASGTLLSEHVYGDVVFKHGESEVMVAPVQPPGGYSGVYKVFVIVKNQAGLLLSLAHAGEVEGTEEKKTAQLEECEFIGPETQSFKCEASGAEEHELQYIIYKNSSYGQLLAKNTIPSSDLGAHGFNLNPQLPPGRYEVVFELKDAEGSVYPRQQNITFEVPGSWAAVKHFSSSVTGGNLLEATLRFDGAGAAQERGFAYWILSGADEVCASGVFALEYLVPSERNIREQLNKECVTPRFVGILYDGENEDGTLQIIDSAGEADFATLATLIQKSKQTNNSLAYIFLAAIFLIVLAAGWYFFVYKKDNGNGAVAAVGIIFLLGIFTPLDFADADASWASADDPHITFSVNFAKSAFLPTEEVLFDFAFIDEDNGDQKTAGASVEMKIDDGEYTEIISPLETGYIFDNISAGIVAVEGIHTLTFRSPDMCGSAFNHSMFFTAKFGTDDCDSYPIIFEVSVVEGKDKPSAPFISGSCTPGSSDIYSFLSSYDPDDDDTYDDIYYDVIWEDTSMLRIPEIVDTYIPSAEWVQASLDCSPSQDRCVVKARATGADGARSEWSTSTIIPSSMMGDPEYTFGGGGCDSPSNFGIEAEPRLVRLNAKTQIRWWALQGLAECSVTGGNEDYWEAGQQGTNQSLAIEGHTLYTLSCYSACADDYISTTTVVNIAPKWREE